MSRAVKGMGICTRCLRRKRIDLRIELCAVCKGTARLIIEMLERAGLPKRGKR